MPHSRIRRTLVILLVLATSLVAQKSLPPLNPTVEQVMDAGEALQKKGDYPGALERFRGCFRLAAEKADERGQAACLQLIGGIERVQGEYVLSERDYREALVHAESAGDLLRVSYILNNLANLFGAQGRLLEAVALLRRCLAIDESEGFPHDAAPHQNLAISYSILGDHALALESFLKALKIYEELGLKNKIALVHYNLGVLQLKQGNTDAARRELDTAQTIAEAAKDWYVATAALGDAGRLKDLDGHPAEARASFEKALSLCRNAGFQSCIGDNELNLGNFHLRHQEAEAAGAAFERAHAVFEPLHDAFNDGQALRGLGYAARLRSDFKAAATYALKAFDLSQTIADPDGAWQSQTLLGLVLENSGDPGGARTAYQQAIQFIERQRGKVGGGEAEQQRFFEKALYPYQQLALLEAAGQHPLEALRTAESARSRVLLDMLAQDPESIGRTMTEAERTGERQLLATIAGLNFSLERAQAAAKPAIRSRQEAAWGEYENFRAALYVRHPEVRSSRAESPVITEQEIAGLLPDSHYALMEFVSANDKTLLIVATRGAEPGAPPRVAAFPISIGREALGKRTEAFRTLLEQRDPGFRAEATSLFRLLLEPAAAVLSGKTRIQLVADGPLVELPFEALLDRSGKYWIESVTLASAPSLSFLRDQSLRPAAVASPLDFVAFADPAARGAAQIPALREQALKAGLLYDRARTRVLTGADADEAAFRRLAPDAKIIHLATHGMADTGNAMRSRLLLARSPATPAGAETAPETSNDGWLEAWELMQLDLKADVAVLSACETGRGRVTGGEGLVGLTWALFAAGVHNTVASLWPVESGSTTDLMTGFYRQLRRGGDTASALRSSTLAVMKDPRYRHPYYWSAFVASGRFEPQTPPK